MAVKKQMRMSPGEQAKIFAALGDPLRVRFMETLLGAGEQSGSKIADDLGISLALFCHHSKILQEAGLIEKRKAAQTSYYLAKQSVLDGVFTQLKAGIRRSSQ